jgi:hypothetical protein
VGGGAKKAQAGPDTPGQFRGNYISYLQRLLVERPTRRRSPGVAGMMASKFSIGQREPTNPALIFYEEGDFARAKDMLTALGAPTQPAIMGMPRVIEKKKELRPAPVLPLVPVLPLAEETSHVAVQLIGAGYRLPPGTSYLSMPWRDAARLPCTCIVACERLSSLSRLHRYRWLESYLKGRPATAIYVGSTGLFQSASARSMMEVSTAPVIALVSFDPQGLAKAAALPRLEAIALPEFAEISRAAARPDPDGDFAIHASRHGRDLEKASHPHVSALWALMKKYGKGVSVVDFPEPAGLTDPLTTHPGRLWG